MTSKAIPSGSGNGVGTKSVSRFIPSRKVGVGTLAGAVTIVFVWALNTYAIAGHPIPAEIGSAITTVFTFVLSYLAPEAQVDGV